MRRQRFATSDASTGFRRKAAFALAATLLLAPLAESAVVGAPLDGELSSTLRREPQVTPEELGDGRLDGLQYADPTEGLVLVDPPEVNNGGGNQLSYPLIVPHGRGLQPQLSIDYDSGGANSWVGTGWDLDVGSIEVDAEFGAPRFSTTHESESYLLNGDMLIPNAMGDTWATRVTGSRADYTRKVETEYEQIIRHEAPGGGPKHYFWEVRDKAGNIRWYGGQPDRGGPDAYVDENGLPWTPTIDRNAVVTDSSGNIVKWLLSAERDVGVNMMRYTYEKVQYRYGTSGWLEATSCTSSATTMCANHTYLSRIDYTSASAKSGHAEDPAYQVHFLRESDVRPSAAVRRDPIVDAMGGYVDLVIDRLARVEVRYGDPEPNEAPRTYDQVTNRYDLNYVNGPFGKTMLRSIDQIGSDLTTKETHTFDYFDEVRDTAGNYAGFGAPVDWDTGNDLPARQLLTDEAEPGALGSSETNSGEGHAYFGFNPISPTKVGSFGGAIQLGGGATEALAEWLDLNGDGLSDKVYRDPTNNDVDRNGPIYFRLNRGGPGGSTTFGPSTPVGGTLTKLSTDGNFSYEGSFQAFPVVTVAFGLGLDVTWGENYFSDVNSDGLPDFVSGGQVYFNRLVSGVPTFELGNSAATPVPIASGTPMSTSVPQVTTLEADLAEQSPLVDTVRRWIAPYAGAISINAPVTLSPSSGTSVDGVRVAIQRGNSELAAANLLTTGAQAFTSAITTSVTAGQAIYFRVGSISDGTRDEVTWSPTITYTAITGVAAADFTNLTLDQNGLSQKVYSAANDFTLSGRPGSNVLMPLQGTVRYHATITKARATTDDLKLVVLHGSTIESGSATVVSTPTVGAATTATVAANAIIVPAAFTGTIDVTYDFDVSRPVEGATDNDPPTFDTVSTHLAVNSQIDITAITWNPTLHYRSAVDDSDVAVVVALDANDEALTAFSVPAVASEKPTITMEFPPEIQHYPDTTPVAVSLPWRAGATGTYDIQVVGSRSADNPGGTAYLTVKQKTATGSTKVYQTPISVAAGSGSINVTIDANLAVTSGADYWIDLTIANADVSDRTSFSAVTLHPNGEANHTNDVAAGFTYRRSGRQGVFPLRFRGWAVAGYNGNGTAATTAIDETAFTINTSGLNANTPVQEPTGFDDTSYDPPTPDRSYLFTPVTLSEQIPGQPTVNSAPAWRGARDNLSVTAQRVRSSRLGSDTVTLANGGAGRGVTRIGLTAPSASLAFGFGPLGASFGVAPSFGLVDFEDLNGDGYPDIITPSAVQYTTPRGGLEATSRNPGEMSVTNQDLTFAVSGGFSSGLVDIKGNTKGKANANQGSASGKGGDANASGGGIGLGIEVNAEWTSPNASGPSDSPLLSGGTNDPLTTYADQAAKTPQDPAGSTAPIQQALADVNGDGLPDRVYTNPQGVFVKYNLGYSFTAAAVKLATGGFESQESYSGGVSFGFSTPWADFGGGVALNWDADMSRYSWRDVNGDGILDQVHKVNNTDPPTVAFGTGTGILPPVRYGTMASTSVAGTNAGQNIGFDRSTGLGGGFEFTIAVGPLCLVACYLIINPGASYQNSISSTEIDLDDVDGDGYPDSLLTTDDNVLQVRRNLHGKTNLLKSMTNPLGGTMTFDYARYGNTVDSPDSVYALSKVDTDDGHVGDGVDVRRTSYVYGGLKYDRLHRESLGFSRVDAEERDASTNELLRVTRFDYLNSSVFTSGLQTAVTVLDPSGAPLRGNTMTWSMRDVRTEGAVSPISSFAGLSAPASLGYSLAPLVTQTRELWFLGDGTFTVPEETRIEFTYDAFGNPLHMLDLGELEDPNDNVLAEYVYSTCSNATGGYDATRTDPTQAVPGEFIGCNDGTAHPSPLWDDDRCYTWVNLPVTITLSNGKVGAAKLVYRERDGHDSVCDNNSVTFLEETIDGTTKAVTELQYDDWGSYNRIVYPTGETGRRYAVEYTYDDDNHGNIAEVQEYELDAAASDEFLYADVWDPSSAPLVGLSSSAEFDPITNRVSRRTDSNGNAVDYGYDAMGRIRSIGAPRPVADPSVALVTYTYSVDAGGSYAVAAHTDRFNPGNTVDTGAFVDGVGRLIQTKRDASLFDTAGQPSNEGLIVAGGLKYDNLGRPVEEYRPRRGSAALGTFDSAALTGPFTTTTYDLWDLPGVITEPGDRVTTLTYDYAAATPGGPVVMQTTSVAPNGRTTVTYADIREVTTVVDDIPALVTPTQPELRTTFESDGVGQLRRVVDAAGNATTHSYDLLGRRLSTTTPDGGLVEFSYDAEGKQIGKVTPNLRALNQRIRYSYELGKVTGIDYPGTTPDVTYTYGGADATGNGAGRLVRSEDGSRIITNTYNAAGEVISQTAEIKTHQWNNPGFDRTNVRWTTMWDFDPLGRVAGMTYPDGAVLTYDYDFGGQVNRITGSEEGLIRVQIGTDPVTGAPIFEDQPRTWNYTYLADRQYDEFFRAVYDKLGNDAETVRTFDENTQWLSTQRTVSPRRTVPSPQYAEIQDLRYTYDAMGNPLTYANELPPPTSQLFGGPTRQTYRYDGYERLVHGDGTWTEAAGKVRTYTFDLTFDANGNVSRKEQHDRLNGKDLTGTSYTFTRAYSTAKPHQATSSRTGNVTSPYSYDANGNFLGLKDAKGKFIRQIAWDASDRMRQVTDGPQVTDYQYDDTGQRTIERGPSGETLFVNPWLTIRNTNEMWKHIWAGDERLSVQKENPQEYEETDQYFLHKDLQGSTNMVSDISGKTFQHHEYFPTGEVWVDEKSTVYRTPYQYSGAYVDEVRKIISIGARFYDQNREFFYSPDPILVDDPTAMVGTPELRSAYSYAGSNPLRFIDPSGLKFSSAHIYATNSAKAARVAKQVANDRSAVAAVPAMRALLDAKVQAKTPKAMRWMTRDLDKAQKRQDRAERFAAKPLIEIDLGAKTVKFSVGMGKRAKIGGDDASATASTGSANPSGPNAGAATNAPSGASNSTGAASPANATGASGGPNSGGAPARPSSPAPGGQAQPSAPNAPGGSGGKPPPPPVPSRTNRPALSQPTASGGTGQQQVSRPDNGV